MVSGRVLIQDDEHGWIEGITTEIEISRNCELLGEVHGGKDGSTPTEGIVNVRAREKNWKQIVLRGSGGAGLNRPSGERVLLRVYAAPQRHLAGQFDLRESPGGT